MLFRKLNSWFGSLIRLSLAVVICSMLFVSSAYPVLAAPSSIISTKASLQDKANDLDDYEPDITDSNPEGIEEVTREAKKGLNSVQAGAGENNIIDSQDADTTAKETGGFLDNLFN